MSETQCAYYIQILSAEFARRKRENAAYSLNAFARQINMHPSALSRVLRSKQALSIRCSLAVVKKLNLTDQEKRLFLSSVAEEKIRLISDRLARALNPPISYEHLRSFLRGIEAAEGPPMDLAH